MDDDFVNFCASGFGDAGEAKSCAGEDGYSVCFGGGGKGNVVASEPDRVGVQDPGGGHNRYLTLYGALRRY